MTRKKFRVIEVLESGGARKTTNDIPGPREKKIATIFFINLSFMHASNHNLLFYT